MSRFYGCEGSTLVFEELLVFKIRGEFGVRLYKIKLAGTFLMTRKIKVVHSGRCQ